MVMSKAYSVQFEATPNPAAMKFLVGREIASEAKEFSSMEDSFGSPLASKLFGFPWVVSVFIGRDFVTVTKQDWVQWEFLASPLANIIEEHFERGEAVFVRPSESGNQSRNSQTETQMSYDSESFQALPIEEKVRHVVDREIRPAVAVDGGDIVLNSVLDNVVYIHMRGSCSGCPSSTYTLKMGIEGRLKELFPEIKEVIAL